MGLFGSLIVYKLGKRRANKQRDRQERRAEFREMWENTKTPVDYGWEPYVDEDRAPS